MRRAPTQALVHSVQAPPATLRADLELIAALSLDDLRALCDAARELLRGGTEEESARGTVRKALRHLGVDAAAAEAAARALCYIMASAAAAGRPHEELLTQGMDAPALSSDAQTMLRTFYAQVAPELEQELKRFLHLPRYEKLAWRLQVRLGGRYIPRRAPQPSFLIRLHTTKGDDRPAGQHLMRADLANMRRLTSELECALREDKSTHSRRVARRI